MAWQARSFTQIWMLDTPMISAAGPCLPHPPARRVGPQTPRRRTLSPTTQWPWGVRLSRARCTRPLSSVVTRRRLLAQPPGSPSIQQETPRTGSAIPRGESQMWSDGSASASLGYRRDGAALGPGAARPLLIDVGQGRPAGRAYGRSQHLERADAHPEKWAMAMNVSTTQRHHVVVIGSGFGGLFAAKALRDVSVDVTVIAKTKHHLFQQLLYQVATGILSEGAVAPSTREILRRQRNVEVRLGEVIDIDVESKTVTAWTPTGTVETPYDSLIVAAGSTQSYFGHDNFAEHAPGLKSIDDALELRGRILSAFEFAEVVDVDEYGITILNPDGSTRRIQSRTKVWAAWIAASPLATHLAAQAGLQVDRQGRVPVEDDCSLPGFPEVFVIGDMMDAGVPAVAQVAMQSGRYVAKVVAARTAGAPMREPFTYVDKGSMATISRFAAVASVGRFRFSGFVAWLVWLVIHLFYLIGFKQRVTTLLHWTISFVGRGRATTC